jgi:hypothetical protein
MQMSSIIERRSGDSSQSLSARAVTVNGLFAIVAIALLARLIALHFTTLDSGDSVARVFLGWQWLEQPFFITDGVWGPLHFYLIGAALWIWPDPVWAPIVLHLLIGCITPIVIYEVALELFGSSRGALLAAVGFAVYPLAIMTSVEAHPEAPFMLFLALTLLFLIRARRDASRLSHTVWAAVCVGLASMLRYEAWMLLPFLTLLLLPRWQQAALFLAIALIHPIIWMVGNALLRGDPLYSFNWASNWELNAMGHERLVGVAFAARRIWEFVMTTLMGLSLPLSLLTALGIASCLRGPKRAALRWLLPSLGLFLLLCFAAARGSIWVKPTYTTTFGLMLLPFTASIFVSMGVDRWPWPKVIGTAAAMVCCVSLFTIEPLWHIVPHTRFLYSPAKGAFAEQDIAAKVNDLVDRVRDPQSALVMDFLGWQPTPYIALHAKVPPKEMCIPNGAPSRPVDQAALESFLLEHRTGVLITRTGGKLTALLREGTAQLPNSLSGVPLRLERVGNVEWQGAQDATDVGPGTISVLRYSVSPAAGSPRPSRPSCSMPCPLSFCSN